jgi:type IV pilus assembly protein PilQ
MTLILIISMFPVRGLTQNGKPTEMRRLSTSPAEMVSMSSTLPMARALEVLNDLSRRFANKVIIDIEGHNGPIGVDIVNMHWLDALEQILRANNLVWVEGKDHFLVKSPGKAIIEDKISSEKMMYASREAVISVLFFEMNTSQINQLGMSWNILNDNGEAVASRAADEKVGLFQVDVKESLDLGELTATLKALSNRQLGEMLASPQITVRSGQEGRIQIGSDFSVTTKDFAGNAVTQFFSTGSIITVTPEIMTLDSVTFIHLDLEVQKSNANNSELGIEVKKTSAQTSILLLNGEETMIGGLFYNEVSNIREGIPILKDLPWWVFGIRYLAGYETSNKIRKELIVILRAELLPSLRERVVARRAKVKDPKVLEQNIDNFEKRLDSYLEQSNSARDK